MPGDAGVAGASVEIVIERTLVDGAPESLVVPQGSRVRLILHGDTEMELHLHGYDLTAVVRPGSPAVFTFTAVHTGRFAVVAHDDGGLLGPREVARAYIEVHPV